MAHDIFADGLSQVSDPAQLRRHVVPQAVEDLAIRIAVELGLNQLPEPVIQLTSKPRAFARAQVGEEGAPQKTPQRLPTRSQ